ncbi:hypothetical protein CVIRNUC_007181 [Coccomyxa viridis]|uniref:Protein kinase domain-containing protein n=1 Tax=Coccomyxa viridis TaxID=1274662 RepID=A0AAV1I9C0_9CHLO|nr:hypothetical protein CVIRNUC_007181 [Coccomyxa viridis]
MAGKPEAKLFGDITPVSPLDLCPDDDVSSVESANGQQIQACRLASLRQTQHELAWQALEENMRPQKALAVFPGWLGPSALGGVCFQEDYQLLADDAVLGQALRGTVYRCCGSHPRAGSQEAAPASAVLVRPLSSFDDRRNIARQRRALEKVSSAKGVIQLQRAYADIHQAYLVFRLPESGRRLSDIAQKGAVQSRDLLMLTLAILQALAEIHAAGVCLLDICEESIWITEHGSAAFLDFSMAHEFVPGEAELVCALPALALTQRHAAPELANARARHEASGRLAPFSGPKVDVWAVGKLLKQVLHAASSCCTATFCASSGLQALLADMVSHVPAARPDALQALQQCRAMQ